MLNTHRHGQVIVKHGQNGETVAIRVELYMGRSTVGVEFIPCTNATRGQAKNQGYARIARWEQFGK